MKMTKGKIIAIIVIIAVLIAAFCWGGDFAAKDPDAHIKPGQEAGQDVTPGGSDLPPAGEGENTPVDSVDIVDNSVDEISGPVDSDNGEELNPGDSQGEVPVDNSSAEEPDDSQPDIQAPDKSQEPSSEDKPAPVDPQNATISDKALTCVLEVRCDTLLDNLNHLNEEKVELVPSDGVILARAEVTFYEGESVFNVLQREMKRNKIHFEFVNTPVYNSAYIEGINNIYEFECGELSGWMYEVNGWYPNYGCARYQLEAGDEIVFRYTCDLGRDINAEYAGGMQKDE